MWVVVALLCMAPGSCCKRDIVKPSFRAMSSAPPGTVWFGPVTLVADNQQFHIGNEPFLFRSGATDRNVSSSAARVPQQDLFGNSLLGLAATDSRAMIVHLGDAMDLSCAAEWDAFKHTLDTSGRPSWFWAPGNHDGYFFGNFIGPSWTWRAACGPSSSPMSKDQILAKYIAHLQTYSNNTLDPARGSFSCAAGASCGGLRGAAWHIESGDRFYRSFVVQELAVPAPAGVVLPPGSNVSGVSLMLIDTSTYERPPRIAPSEPMFRYAAGESGHLGPAQLAIIERWLDVATKQGRRVILAGHHPFNDIDESDRTRLQELMDTYHVATYVSAHTHWGTYYGHAGASTYSWLEPNLGSILDYDAEFGELSLGVSERSDQHFVRMTRIKLLSILGGKRNAQLGIVCDDNPAWFPRPEDEDFFTRYKATTSPRPSTLDKLYFSTMLSALDRYWRCVPTAPAAVPLQDMCVLQPVATCVDRSEMSDVIKNALASGSLDKMRSTTLSLLEQDATRAVDACQRRAYAVCQAMWAAEYEKRNYTTPSRDEDIFEVTSPTVRKP